MITSREKYDLGHQAGGHHAVHRFDREARVRTRIEREHGAWDADCQQGFDDAIREHVAQPQAVR